MYCEDKRLSLRGSATMARSGEGRMDSPSDQGRILHSVLPTPSVVIYPDLSPGLQSNDSPLFVVMKTSGEWKPVIDLSRLNRFVTKTKFRTETVRTVLSSIHRDDWMVSIDLQDAYLQIPMHHTSRKT